MKVDKLIPMLNIEFNVQETVSLLKSEGFRFLSWGCDKLLNTFNKGLLLHVNGHHHKGWVLVTLNGSDLYDFQLLNGQLNIVGEKEIDIYFDDLFERIDKRIEFIPEYTR